jgi:hypothetical protein
MHFALSQGTELLKRTPHTLSALLANLSDPWVTQNEGPETWSPFDVIGHLIHAEETDWIPRVRTILEHGESRAFEPFDRFAMIERSKGKTMHQLLEIFQQMRSQSLGELQRMNITPALLEKKGKHPEFGPVSLSQLLATWVVHDLGHIAQISRVMSKQYGEAVGPWQAYLPVLTR